MTVKSLVALIPHLPWATLWNNNQPAGIRVAPDIGTGCRLQTSQGDTALLSLLPAPLVALCSVLPPAHLWGDSWHTSVLNLCHLLFWGLRQAT